MSAKKSKNKKENEGLFHEKMPLLRIVSLGCAKNFVDTEVAAASLLQAGFGLTPDDSEADMIFINTCAFLEAARQEAEKEIQYAENWKKARPDVRKIIVAGCLIEWDKNFMFHDAHPLVDAWVNIDSIEKIGMVAKSVWNGDQIGETCFGVSAKKYLYSDQSARLQLTPHHYAYLKIADGCDNCCTYCMIPMIRGSLRSRTVDSVVREAENLIASGVRELIVIAQDTSAFGRERNHGVPQLGELLKRLDLLEGDFLIRLMYLHPASVDEALLNVMKSCRRLIRCIEMPLQHISEPVLQAMHRRISEKDTRELVRKLQQDMHFSIRTTFMTGFPGETEEDFKKLCDFVRSTGFTRLGVFAFSPEKGTAAAEMPGQVPEKIAEARCAEIMGIQQKISLEANQALIGKTVEVILDEEPFRGNAVGRTFLDAPEIDNTVFISGIRKGCHAGDFIQVKIESAGEYELKGVYVSEETDPGA